MNDPFTKALVEAGLQTTVDSEGNLKIIPSFLKFQSITINVREKGRYIRDPNLYDMPEEDNILWQPMPIEAFGTTEDGEEIPIYVQQITENHEKIWPE